MRNGRQSRSPSASALGCGQSPEQAEVVVAESESHTWRKVLGVSLIAGSLAIGFLLFLYFPMPQKYTTTVGGEELAFTTECTISGDVVWSPSPAPNPDHVAQAEDYCGQWSGPVVALSFLIPIIGVVAGAFILPNPPRKQETEEDVLQGASAGAQ